MSTLLMNHAKIIIRMYKNGINEYFIEEYPLNDIIDCCDRIEETKILNNDYKNNKIFQEELIRDKNFIKYLNLVYEKELDVVALQTLIEDIRKHNEKISDYHIEDVYNVLSNRNLFYNAYYSYLKYFSNEDSNLKEIITNNLNHFYEQSNIQFDDITEKERELFKLNFLENYNLIPTDDIKEIYGILVNNEELINLIDFLYGKKMYIPLDLELYNKISSNSKEIRILIQAIMHMVSDDDIIYQMLLKWLKNGCKVYDLKVIKEKVADISQEKLKDICKNRSEYINFIYGSKLKKFPLEVIYGDREDLIIYAISNNKNSFLKLIEDNINEFLSIPIDSILYDKNFYNKYINLNELTIKHLNKLKTMTTNLYSAISYLENKNYTFEEIMTLYNVNKNYILLYNHLLDLKVDARLLRIRQFTKKKLLERKFTDIEIENLAEKIKIKPLYIWLEEDFSQIKDIRVEDVIQILINYEHIQKYIPEITSKNEISYVLRNMDKSIDYNSLLNLKDNIENIDTYWKNLKENMNLKEEFIQTYDKNIKEFLLNNGAELAYKYYINRNHEQKDSYKLIIKAELMGEFKKLKYHTNDLNDEIDYTLNAKQIKEWTENNSKIIEEKYDIGEYDDFYHTMILGEYPQHTCLSYINGMYNECLLACFDSNKKILYAKINGKIVARAMVRLTKGTFNKGKQTKSGLRFIDLEENIQNKEDNENEYLTLFLEKPYISGISQEETKKIKGLFIELLKRKAKQMEALLVLNCNYTEAVDEQFVSTRYYMYISKSKSSSQYLDSLEGPATISDEGQYKVNTFLIWKPEDNKKSIFEESIFD